MSPAAPAVSSALSLLLATALACGATAPVATPVAAPVATPVAASAPEPTPAREVLTGPPTPETPVAGDERFTGLVLERLPAGPYTYLQVATERGARWVVTMGAAPEGAVEVRNMGVRKHFHARRLGREFDELVFGIVASVGPRASEKI
jgi:hypothetical protein